MKGIDLMRLRRLVKGWVVWRCDKCGQPAMNLCCNKQAVYDMFMKREVFQKVAEAWSKA